MEIKPGFLQQTYRNIRKLITSQIEHCTTILLAYVLWQLLFGNLYYLTENDTPQSYVQIVIAICLSNLFLSCPDWHLISSLLQLFHRLTLVQCEEVPLPKLTVFVLAKQGKKIQYSRGNVNGDAYSIEHFIIWEYQFVLVE